MKTLFHIIQFKKNIKLKLVLNNAVLKGWKAAIRFWSEKDKDR